MPDETNGLEPFNSRQVVCELPDYNIKIKLLFLQLNGSMLIWIGDEEGRLSGLSVCLPSNVAESIQQHSTIIYSVNSTTTNSCDQTACQSFSEYEENLSRKLSKRLNCPVFVSISLSSEYIPLWNSVHFTTGSTFGQEVERHLFDNLSSFVPSK
ncbi:unnamed protein product [Trichobilharzia regenti]|nr:unnamed protein product [Trichobilharzia regenti]